MALRTTYIKNFTLKIIKIRQVVSI